MYITVRPLSAWKKKGEDTRMVEKEVILRRLTLLEEYCNDLEEAKRNISWERFSQNKVFKRYIERTLQMAIEACLDIGNHIISYEGYREPVDNKDVFEVLHEQMIINEELKDRLKKMVQFRNVIVHDYVRILPEIVYSILTSNLADILEFAVTIKDRYIV
jgi:uncharacterized protein YutE (UPF0331/DUF86 family)